MLNNVKQFMHTAGGLPRRGEPDHKLAGLYVGLALEEMAELMESQGLTDTAQLLNNLSRNWKQGVYTFIHNVEALDAMIDVSWVALGGAYAMGADVEGAAQAVADNNLSKFPVCTNCIGTGWHYVDIPCNKCGGTGRIVLRDSNGKIKKPEGFKAVELDKYL